MQAILDTTGPCNAVALETIKGLIAMPKSLPAWLFYDAEGTVLFEKITCLPEYYLTRAERDLLLRHARELLDLTNPGEHLTLVELGAGTATKTGILLSEVLRRQPNLIYQPVDVSETALAIAKKSIELSFSGVEVRPQVADYTSERLNIGRATSDRVLMVYLGSSIGNYTSTERNRLLRKLREQLRPGDWMLVGADLVKDERVLLPAYDDATNLTAAFNLNLLARLNREVGTDFDLSQFRHLAIWNARESRIEMHLKSKIFQSVLIPSDGDGADIVVDFTAGETIHTENSYKFTTATLSSQLCEAGFEPARIWEGADALFSLALARAF